MTAPARLGATRARVVLALAGALDTSTCIYCIHTRYTVIGGYMYKQKKEIRHKEARDVFNYQTVRVAYANMSRPAFDFG